MSIDNKPFFVYFNNNNSNHKFTIVQTIINNVNAAYKSFNKKKKIHV